MARVLQLVSWPASLALVCPLICLACADDPEPPEVPQIEYCAPVDGWDPQLAAFERDVLAVVNETRGAGAICGKDEVLEPGGPLTMEPALRCAARVHALDMSEQDYFSNLDPDGLRYADRVELAGYDGLAIGQNIGAAHPSPEQLVAAIMSNNGPCQTLMDPAATEVGVGYALASDAEYPNYWALVYGQR